MIVHSNIPYKCLLGYAKTPEIQALVKIGLSYICMCVCMVCVYMYRDTHGTHVCECICSVYMYVCAWTPTVCMYVYGYVVYV